MALPLDVKDPGSVNIEDQGFGLGIPVTVNVGALASASGRPAVDVDGDNGSPIRGAAIDVTANNVAGQVFGVGAPRNVLV